MRCPKLRLTYLAGGLTIGIALLLTAVFLWLPRDRAPWEEVRIATGPVGGTYLPLGRTLARILTRNPDIQKTTAYMTNGSEENLQLLVKDSVDIAFVSSHTITHAPKAKREEVRVLARLYAEATHIVVRRDAGIDKLADLNAKTVYVGPEGSAVLVGEAEEHAKATTNTIMATKGQARKSRLGQA